MESREAVFNDLIDHDLAMLRGVAMRILHNAADVDEAIQNALLAAWRKFHTFKGQAKLSSWVCRITVNNCYDILRKSQRETQKQAEFAAGQADIGTSAATEDAFCAVAEAIAELPEIYRQAITVGFLSGFSNAQAAEILECTENTLRQRVHKAKQFLKAHFAENKDEK